MTWVERAIGEGLPPGFSELPARVYGDDPMWIPEDPAALLRSFSPDNPWFARGDSVLLAVPDEARLALFFQPDLRIEGRRAAFFGYWESARNPEADVPLFDRACAIAKARGAEDLYGPINFTTFGNYRLRLSSEPGAWTFPDEPYNPSYYPSILEASGFALDQTYLTQVGTMEAGRMVREWKRPEQDKLLGRGYRVETLTHSMWMDALPELHGLIDHIFGANFAYSALSFESFAAKCGESFIRRACPHTSVMARGPEGDIAGFFLVYPHYGPLVTQAAGPERLSSSTLSYEEHAPRLAEQDWRGCVAKTVGVAPAHRGEGVMNGLTVGIFDRGDGRYEHWLGAMIRKGNFSSNFAEGNTVGERWYGLYRRAL